MRDFTDDLRDVARRVAEASGYLGIDEARNRLVELEAEIGRPDLGGREGIGGRLRGRRALRREGEVGTRD